MQNFYGKATLALPFLFISYSYAQGTIAISSVPTSSCVGNPVGTATFTSDVTLSTGELRIPAGSFWDQAGALWEVSTDSKGFAFQGPGIPGYGAGFGGSANDVPAAAENAIKLSNDKSTISIVMPTATLGGEWDVVWGVVPSSVANSSTSTNHTTPGVTWPAGACSLSTFTDSTITCGNTTQSPLVPTSTVCACPSSKVMLALDGGDPCKAYTSDQGDLEYVSNYCTTSIAKRDGLGAPKITDPPTLRSPSVHGKFRRQAPANQVHINIRATWPCQGPPDSSKNASSNPTLASMCANNAITPGPQAWTTYEVSKYMSSLMSANAPSSISPQVDGVAVIHGDVNPPGAQCTYTSKCESINCQNVKDYTTGSVLTIQRYLAYTAVVNLNNYLNSITSALLDSATITGLTAGSIVSTFYTNPTPDATWEQIMGLFTPFLGMFSAMVGPFSAVGGAALGVGSGIASAVTAGGTLLDLAPVADKRFDEYSSITAFIGDYLKTAVKSIESAFDQTIGPDSSQVEWTGSPYAPSDQRNGIFGDGYFANSDFSQDMTNQLLEKMIRIFTYKAINFAWVDSGVFIIYVPYGRPVKGTDGKMISGGIDEDWCNANLKDKKNLGTLTICNAPGGMARIFNAGNADDSSDMERSSPKGYDQNFNVLPDEPFHVSDAIIGSVASWQAGDFGYDASEPYQDAFNSTGLSDDQVTQLSKLDIAATTAGFFNIPVCQTWDLRFFPPASGQPCAACNTKASVGGTKGSQTTFWSKAGKTITDALQGDWSQEECGGLYTACVNNCPGDAYDG